MLSLVNYQEKSPVMDRACRYRIAAVQQSVITHDAKQLQQTEKQIINHHK